MMQLISSTSSIRYWFCSDRQIEATNVHVVFAFVTDCFELFFLAQKLADLSTVPTARLIDGILLTKFDTIDDKVGGTCAEHMLD